MHWWFFGSNGQEKADYSRGVLERFTRRDKNVGAQIKTVSNPRAINFITNPHYAIYFEGKRSVNENGVTVQGHLNRPATSEKIVINHYHTKSREEYQIKRKRGIADRLTGDNYSDSTFKIWNRDAEFDDGILKYRDERAKIYQPLDNSHADERLLTALAKNLSPMILPTVPSSFYKGKLETFLTCRAVSNYLRGKFPHDERLKFYEEASLKAVLKSMASMTFADARLLLSELPNLLPLPYPVVNDLRGACLNIIPQIMGAMHLNNLWKDYVELDYLQRLLQAWR